MSLLASASGFQPRVCAELELLFVGTELVRTARAVRVSFEASHNQPAAELSLKLFAHSKPPAYVVLKRRGSHAAMSGYRTVEPVNILGRCQ